MSSLPNPCIAVLSGTTASGKTAVSLEFAAQASGIEIINADSLLVYRGFDIGTAKPSLTERAQTPHHLIDIQEPSVVFTAGDYRTAALQAVDGIHSRGKRALFVGGTGFYLKALLYGLWDAPKADPELRRSLEVFDNGALYRELLSKDEQAALRIGGNDRYRLLRAIEILRLTGKTPTEFEQSQSKVADPRFRLLIVDRAQAELDDRITQRAQAMLRDGLVDEVRSLMHRYPEARALDSVGYRQTVAWLKGIAPEGRKLASGEQGLLDEIALGTRQLVKSQRTWFRGEPLSEFFELDRDRDKLYAALREIYL